MKKYTENLTNITKKDLNIAGGKAANLGEMMRASLPVPEGFVVLTAAYKKFVKDNNIEEKIGFLIEGTENDFKKLDEASAKIKDLFDKSEMPKEIGEEIVGLYDSLDCESVVVRSSATAEDLPGMSFAGQYNTYLNVRGHESLKEHIKKCWASLWNARAVAYRNKQNLKHHDIAHGVVVQKLVNSTKSGIIFTANPLSGRRDEILLNSSWGLGEAVVGGDVNPDQWIFNKEKKEINEEKISLKEVMSIRKNEGIELVKVKNNLQNKSTLNENELKELFNLALKTENYYQSPQDIEWAYDGKFYLVQTRPITSLYPVPGKKEGREGLRIYLNISNYSQAMKEPFTPLGEDLIVTALKRINNRIGKEKKDSLWWCHVVGGRLFVDITAYLRKEKFWNKFRKDDPNDKDPVTTKIILQLCEREKEELLSKKERVNFKELINPKAMIFAFSVFKKFFCGVMSPVKAREKSKKAGEDVINKIREDSKKQKTKEDKISFIQESIEHLLIAGATTIFYVMSSSMYIKKAKDDILKYIGESKDVALVEKSVPHSVTTQMGIKLLKVAKHYDEKGKKPSIVDEKMKEIIKEYGHKKMVELDIGTLTWEESPEYLIDLVNSYIEGGVYERGIKDFNDGAEEAEKAIIRIEKEFKDRGMSKKGKDVVKSLRAFREMFGMREQSKFVITQGLQIFRKVMQEVGEDLVREGRINEINDVFFLRFADIGSDKNLKEIIQSNKEQFYLNEKLNPPRVMTSTGESLYHNSAENRGGELVGLPISPGVVEGMVRIINNPEQGNELKKGEILVTTGTNPAWTPLFLRIRGLIMETGGPISHGSVVAREYGVPAVSGIVDATKKLQTGQRVKIDGETGVVEIVER